MWASPPLHVRPPSGPCAPLPRLLSLRRCRPLLPVHCKLCRGSEMPPHDRRVLFLREHHNQRVSAAFVVVFAKEYHNKCCTVRRSAIQKKSPRTMWILGFDVSREGPRGRGEGGPLETRLVGEGTCGRAHTIRVSRLSALWSRWNKSPGRVSMDMSPRERVGVLLQRGVNVI